MSSDYDMGYFITYSWLATPVLADYSLHSPEPFELTGLHSPMAMVIVDIADISVTNCAAEVMVSFTEVTKGRYIFERSFSKIYFPLKFCFVI